MVIWVWPKMVISLYFIGEMLDWGRFVIEMLESAATMLESYLASPDGEPARRQAVANVLAWNMYACGFLYSHLGLLEQAEAAAARCTALAEELAPGDERDELRFLAAWLIASTVYARATMPLHAGCIGSNSELSRTTRLTSACTAVRLATGSGWRMCMPPWERRHGRREIMVQRGAS